LYLGTLFILGILSLSVFSQGQTTGNKTIASCNVVNPKSGDITAVNVFKTSDPQKPIGVTFSLPSGNQSFPADTYQFSGDGHILEMTAAKFIFMKIVSGRATAGTIGVALGAPPSAMICNAHW
jgi:hypothetical protein